MGCRPGETLRIACLQLLLVVGQEGVAVHAGALSAYSPVVPWRTRMAKRYDRGNSSRGETPNTLPSFHRVRNEMDLPASIR